MFGAVLVQVVVVVQVVEVAPYSKGAPSLACSHEMLPRHGFSPQVSSKHPSMAHLGTWKSITLQ